MKTRDIIKKLQVLEHSAETMTINAQRLKKDAAALREELSGGSDSSLLKPKEKHVLSPKHREELIARRKRTMMMLPLLLALSLFSCGTPKELSFKNTKGKHLVTVENDTVDANLRVKKTLVNGGTFVVYVVNGNIIDARILRK